MAPYGPPGHLRVKSCLTGLTFQLGLCIPLRSQPYHPLTADPPSRSAAFRGSLPSPFHFPLEGGIWAHPGRVRYLCMVSDRNAHVVIVRVLLYHVRTIRWTNYSGVSLNFVRPLRYRLWHHVAAPNTLPWPVLTAPPTCECESFGREKTRSSPSCLDPSYRSYITWPPSQTRTDTSELSFEGASSCTSNTMAHRTARLPSQPPGVCRLSVGDGNKRISTLKEFMTMPLSTQYPFWVVW